MTEVGEGALPPVEQTSLKVSRQAASPAPAVESGTPSPGGDAAVPGAVGEAASEQHPAASPARKSAPLTRRGRATQPIPEPTPEPVTEPVPDADGVIDAEVIEDAPAEQPNVTPLAQAKAEIRAKNIVSAQMHFERILGKPVDREERIWWTRVLVGNQDVESTNDLDTEQLRTLLGKLEKFRDRDQLEALLTAKGGE